MLYFALTLCLERLRDLESAINGCKLGKGAK